MITVAEALSRLLELAVPGGIEDVPLSAAAGRVLARDVTARRDQPPFAAAAMDGYAVHAAEAVPGARFRVVGEAAAGTGWSGTAMAGEAVRIFTGAPVPAGLDRVVIQEDTAPAPGGILLTDRLDSGSNIRPAGCDFRRGTLLAAPRRLSPFDVALLAAFNHAELPVHRRPEVALIATGDELVEPGHEPGPGQIVASNSHGLAALFREAGARVRLLPIARDDRAELAAMLRMAEGADLIVTIGGASVGDHDLVGGVAADLGMRPAFWKVAMRPGKPLMAGRLFGAAMVGLPGNPVSAMVCGIVFVLPMLRAMQGLPPAPAPRRLAPAARALPAEGPREHYLRAVLTPRGIQPCENQDSSLLSVLAGADALLVRVAGAPAVPMGHPCDYIALRD